MVTFDSSAQVYEAWTDDTCSEWLGAFDTYSEARDAVRKGR